MANNSVPYDISAGLSALLYDISGMPNMKDRTLQSILNDPNLSFDHKADLEAIVRSNGLGGVKIVDSSWEPKGSYGTMNAATFQFPNGDVYVAYRGTGDGNWGYNADSAYGSKPSEMQDNALRYFENTIQKNYHDQGQLYVTGHSQGGNNAMYVTLFSANGALITNCISIDGPGFSEEVIGAAKHKWGEAYYELARRKTYAIYGENDYVHQQGEVQTTPPENTFFVPTPGANDIGGFHDIFTHIVDGKLTAGPDNKCTQGEIGKLVDALVANLLKDLPKNERYEIAVIVMKIIENLNIGNTDYLTVDLGLGDIVYLWIEAWPVILKTALQNPGELFSLLHELGLDKEIAKIAIANSLIVGALMLICPPLGVGLLVIEGIIIALPIIIDVIKDIIKGVAELARGIGDFVFNCISSIMDAIGSFAQWFRNTFNPGARYVNSNPYFKVDTAKLRSYATRINNVNNRLLRLDGDMNGLYWQVGFLDLWDILAANLLTSWSPTLLLVKSYLDSAANRFENADNKARGNMGGD